MCLHNYWCRETWVAYIVFGKWCDCGNIATHICCNSLSAVGVYFRDFDKLGADPLFTPIVLQPGEKRRASRVQRGRHRLRPGSEEAEAGDAESNPLDSFATNLNLEAAEGHIDPLIGRANEVERVAQILARRRKERCALRLHHRHHP